MGSRSFPSKRARLEVETTGLDEMERALETGGIDAAQEAFIEACQRQLDFARQRWGVRTGRSRASLQLATSKRPPAFAVTIASAHEPIFYESWNGKRPTFWQVLIQRPLKKLSKRLAKLAAAKLAAEVQDA